MEEEDMIDSYKEGEWEYLRMEENEIRGEVESGIIERIENEEELIERDMERI